MRNIITFKLKRLAAAGDAVGLVPQFCTVYDSVLTPRSMAIMKACRQHKNCNCLKHSIAVAYFSLLLVDRFDIACNRVSLLRGALLHDYHLGDWRAEEKPDWLHHGRFHARAALVNANQEFSLNTVEQNTILRHMFPVNIVPPKYREGVIVCIVDKLCAVYEAASAHPYRALLRRIYGLESIERRAFLK